MKTTTIEITNDTCIRCGRCTKVCPVYIFQQPEKGADIKIVNQRRCIVCGHCVDVCPTQSIVHSDIPAAKVHRINRNLLPTADQVMELIRSRRTNRTMTSRPVPQEAIDKIVEAGYYAPTAENTRLVRIGYVSSPEKLQEIRDFVFDAWGSVAEKMHDAEEWARLKSAHPDYAHVAALYHNLKRSDAKGLDPILRHVTTVVAYAAEPGYEYGDKDCNLAYQNSSLIAEALGISQVYLGFVCGAMKYGDKDRLARILGVEGEIHALMGIGVPAMRYTNYVERGPYQSLVEVGA